jgi:large subunit ribosomal protein L31
MRRGYKGVDRITKNSYNTGLLCQSMRIWSNTMKNEIHPEYHQDCKVFFRGEHVMTVGATVPEMHVDIWSGSHPFYTGKASFVDAAGRVEKFQNKFKGNYFKNKKK